MSFSDNFWAELEKINKKKKKKEEEQTTTASNKATTANNKTTTEQRELDDFSKNFWAELEKTGYNTKQAGKDDIAPVYTNKTSKFFNTDFTNRERTTVFSKAEDEYNKKRQEERENPTWFKEGEGKWWEKVLGSITDIGENITTGLARMPETLVDTLAFVGNSMEQSKNMQNAQNEMMFGALTGDKKMAETALDRWTEVSEKQKQSTADFIAKDLYDEEAVAKFIVSNSALGRANKQFGVDSEASSVFGEKSDQLAQSAGQLAGTIGLQAVGVPWYLTTGVTTFGSETEGALRQEATLEEAGLSAAISVGSEILTEKLGGIGFGGNTLTDNVIDALAKGVTNKLARVLIGAGKLALNATAEGAEEILSGYASAFGQKLTYMSDKEINELFSNEDKLDSFIGGFVLGGIGEVGKVGEAVITGQDYVTGLTKTEQQVVDKIVESRVAEAEKDGKKLNGKEKSDIVKQVKNELESGEISVDAIEEALGGETYNSYKSAIEEETALKAEFDTLNKMKQLDMTGEQIDRRTELKQKLEELKNNSTSAKLKTQLGEEVFGLAKDSKLLTESYNERAKRGQAFEADLTQYDTKQQAVIKNAVESGILNNTNRTHKFVDWIAKISADKGVLFDFTDNAKLKESGFAVEEGVTRNGFVTKDGITINIDSAKSFNSVVGHEITHVLEGTKLYDALQQAAFDYAKSKGEYDSRLASVTELYKKYDPDADPKAELTADLVGDYLFTDGNFIKNLSTKHRNVFQKIYDEIKYLCKVATAGSKEARELEKVKKAFAEAYRERGKVEGKSNTTYNLSLDNAPKTVYNDNRGDGYARTDEFRNLQAESQRMPDEEIQQYHAGREIDPEIRGRLSRAFELELQSAGSERNYSVRPLLNPKTGKQVNIVENVDGALFHDVFEIARKYLENGELVDLHAVETTEDGIGYDDCDNYLSEDGLSGFSITPDGDLISVFNLSDERGFLKTIASVVREKAKTLDCYASPNQNLMAMYEKIFGFKTASIMDYNMEYDHDNIAENHNMPKVAFMVNTDGDVETRSFTKDQYDEAVAYRNGFVDQASSKEGVSFTSEADDAGDIGPVKYSLSEDIDTFDNSLYNEIELSAVERDRVQSEALTWNADKRNQLITQTLSNGITYRYTIDDDGIVHIYGKEQSVNIHDWKDDYGNTNATRSDSITEELWSGYGNDSGDGSFGQDGRESSRDDTNDNNLVSGKGRGNRTGRSKDRSYAHRNPKGWHFNDDGSIEVTYSDGTKETENVAPIKKTSSNDDVFFDASHDAKSSLSANGDTPKSYGRYNVYGKDIMLENAPMAENSAPADNIAPVYNWGIKKDASLGDVQPVVYDSSHGASSDASNNSIADFAPFVKPDEDTVSDDFAPTAEDIAEFFPSDPTLDDLKREAEGLIAEAVKNSEDADTVNRLYEQYKELQKKIRREEAEEAAWNKERLASLTEADAPIEQPHAQYGNELKDTTPLDQKSLEAYARDIAETLNFDLKKKALKESLYQVMQDYSTGKISSFSNLYSEVIRNFGDNGIKTLDENLQDAKNHIRNTKIYASPIVKSDFGSPKEWNNFRLRNSGRLYFSKDRSALGVDSLYSELSEIYPYLFPDSIWNVGDQIRRIAEVASMDHIIQEPLPDEQLQEATTLIHDAVTEYHETERMILADEITKLPIDESLAPPAPIEEKAGGTVSNTKPITENDTSISEDEQPTKLTRKSLHQGIVDTVKNKFTANGFDFDKVLKNAKNLSTFATVDNIPQRVMEKALGYKEGQILADLTVNKVAQNETEGIKWLNSITDRRNGLLAQLQEQYNIKPGSKESAAAQMYAEGFYVTDDNQYITYGDAELAKDFPNVNVQRNIKGLAKDNRIRQFYDETLSVINESRTRNAYPAIPRLDNYFLHFRAMDDTFSRLGLPFNPNDIRAKDLPTDLNGVTADLKPGQPYFASANHRRGNKTTHDLLGGLERYATAAKNQIYHIDDIQTLRALRNYIADIYGQANGLEGLDTLSEEEAQERIEKVYKSHLSTFAKFLNEEANVLAGKTALIDRGLEGVIGRRGMTFLNTINGQVGSNMVGLNISSSLTNFLPVAQTLAKTNKADFVKAFAQTVSNKLGSVFGYSDGFAENSPVIIRRKGADRFYRTPFQKVADSGYVLMSAVDSSATELIARTKFNELTRKGMDEQQAHFETDKWVSRLMGDRSLGQQPQLYNSKMLGLITKFQLEVRNQLDSQFYDTIQEAKVSNEDIKNGLARNAKTAAKITSTFVQLAVYQHLFGKAFESVAGYNPAFDIISVLATLFGFDDDEESEDTVLDNVEQGFLELLEDLPYTSTLTGGRIPISNALPITELVKGVDSYGNEKSRLKTLGEAAPYYLLPGGYGQIKKTMQGLGMFSDEHPISGSYTDSGNLRFPVEDTLGNRIQAGLFGQWASGSAREYFDNEWAPLKPKQTQEYIDSGMEFSEYHDYRDTLAQLKTLPEKFDYIAGLDLTDEAKNILINNIVDRKDPVDISNYDDYGSYEEFDFATKNPEKYDFFKANGISYSTYIESDESKDAYNWAFNNPESYTVSKAVADNVVEYRRYSKQIGEIRDNNDSSSGIKDKDLVTDYIFNELDLDYGQKIILYRSLYSSKDDKATYNMDIIDYLNSRDDISYEEMETILKKLDFTVTENGEIYWD